MHQDCCLQNLGLGLKGISEEMLCAWLVGFASDGAVMGC